MHYTLNGTFEQIIKDVVGAMQEIAEFVEKEVIPDLPQEAQKDFQDSLADYRKYAILLKNYNYNFCGNLIIPLSA
jgi:hypothetical protein